MDNNYEHSDKEFMDELKSIVQAKKNIFCAISRSERFRPLKEWILRKTNDIFGDDDYYTLGNRVFYIVNDLHELPSCANPSCHNKVKYNFKAFSDKSEYYNKHCCLRCVQLNPNVKMAIEKTTMKRYGFKRGNSTEESKRKRAETNLRKFGYASCLHSPEIKKKIHDTVLERYGVDFIGSSPEIQERIRKRNIEKYGY